MFFTKSAIFFQLHSVRSIFLVLFLVVIALFAFRTSKGYLYSHYKTPPKKLHPPKVLYKHTTRFALCQRFFIKTFDLVVVGLRLSVTPFFAFSKTVKARFVILIYNLELALNNNPAARAGNYYFIFSSIYLTTSPTVFTFFISSSENLNPYSFSIFMRS